MVLFAFSMEDQVEKYGAYVGIAAFFGLAVLSLLYFSQARELKRLREWAGRAPERARELEERVVAQATATVARRAPAAPGQPVKPGTVVPARRLAEMPATQTGAAAAATQVAEREGANGTGPVPVVGPGGSVPAGPVNGTAAPTPDAIDPATDAPPDDGGEIRASRGTTDAAQEEEDGATRAFDAAEAAAATGAGEAPAAPAVPRVTPAQRVGVAPRPAPMPLSQTQAAASTRTPAPTGGGTRRPPAPAPRRTGQKPPGRSAGTIALLVGLAVLILGGGAFLGSQLLGGDDTPTPPNQASPPPSQSGEPSSDGGGGSDAGTPPPGETTVAVLNGTTFTGLAGQLADEVAGAGYQRGATATNGDQTIEQSVVYYADGFRGSARAVGKALSIDQVEASDAQIAAVALGADVVVLAGADQAP